MKPEAGAYGGGERPAPEPWPSKGALHLTTSFPDPEGSPGAFPLLCTTSAYDADEELAEKRPWGGGLPSEEEGLKSGHSGSSSPTDLDWLEGGEKGVTLGFKEDEGQWTGGVAEAERGHTPLTARPAVRTVGRGGEGAIRRPLVQSPYKDVSRSLVTVSKKQGFHSIDILTCFPSGSVAGWI
jgi:hypothetical protein